MSDKTNKKAKGRKITVIAVVLLIIIAVVIIIFGKKIGSAVTGNASLQTEEFYYESYSKNTFGWLRGNLLLASSAGIELYGGNGELKNSEIFVMESPAIDISGDYGVVYDIEGTSIRVVDSKGNIRTIDNASDIITVGVNKNGWVVAVTQEDGYKALATVYNDEGTPVYKWYSGTGYIIDADISPSNGSMVAACIGDDGSYIDIFDLTSEEVKYTYSGGNTFIISAEYLNNNRIYAVSDEKSLMLDEKLNLLGETDFESNSLTDYVVTEDSYTVLALSKYYSGNIGELIVNNVDGEKTASLDVEKKIMSVSAAGDYIAVLYSDSVVVYTKDLAVFAHKENVQGVKEILALNSGSVILVSSYSASVFNP